MTSAHVHRHHFIEHEHDESQGNHFPYDGAQRICVDCGAIEVCYMAADSRMWVPKGFTAFVRLEAAK